MPRPSREVLPGGRIILRRNGGIIVQDPNISIEHILDRKNQLALAAEIRAYEASTPLDLNSLDSKLQQVSNGPPERPGSAHSDCSNSSFVTISENADFEAITKRKEERSREFLLKQGCPLCVPPEYSYPYGTDEKTFEHLPGAMYFARAYSKLDPIPIICQKSDWNDFLQQQENDRARCCSSSDPDAEFAKLVARHQESMQHFGFEEAAKQMSLSLQVEDQRFLQTWIEFQAYHCWGSSFCRSQLERYRNRRPGYATLSKEEYDEYLALRRGLVGWIDEQRVILTEAEQAQKSAAPGEVLGEGPTEAAAKVPAHADNDTSNGNQSPDGITPEQETEMETPHPRRSARLAARASQKSPSAVASNHTRLPAPAATLSKTRGQTRVTKPTAPSRASQPSASRKRSQQLAASILKGLLEPPTTTAKAPDSNSAAAGTPAGGVVSKKKGKQKAPASENGRSAAASQPASRPAGPFGPKHSSRVTKKAQPSRPTRTRRAKRQSTAGR